LKKIVRSEWRTVVLVCGKCTRKVNGGFGPKGTTPLVKALRKYAGKGKGRKAGIGAYEVPCLKICPKHAVTVIDGAHPDKWRVVPAGTPVGDVAEQLGLLGVGRNDLTAN
jgi:predicted metal-binding protein